MDTEITIRTTNLVKRFHTRQGDVTAVDGVTLQVRRGETYGLIGPDGAGKTTTTRVILGLLRRTAGESQILGFDSMRDAYEIRHRVGYIAQQFALPPTSLCGRIWSSSPGCMEWTRRRRASALQSCWSSLA